MRVRELYSNGHGEARIKSLRIKRHKWCIGERARPDVPGTAGVTIPAMITIHILSY